MRFRAEVLALAALLCALTAVPAGAQEPEAGAAEPEPEPESEPGSDPESGSGSGSDSGSGSASGAGAAPGSESGAVSESEPESEPESESEPEPESAPAPDPESAALIAERTANSAAYVRNRAAALERALRSAQQDERDARIWLPWAMAGTGVAVLATGLLIGALPTAACDDSCERPFWPAGLVVGGAALATAGTMWLVIHDHDQAELKFRRERIEQQLEYERWNAKPVGRFTLTLSGRL